MAKAESASIERAPITDQVVMSDATLRTALIAAETSIAYYSAEKRKYGRKESPILEAIAAETLRDLINLRDYLNTHRIARTEAPRAQ